MSSERVEIALSPCPNDVFILAGLLLNKVTSSLSYSFTFKDIENLNELALSKSFSVIKASFALYPQITESYQVLSTGAALGFGIGPLLVKKANQNSKAEEIIVGIPGKYTTAHFLFKLFYKGSYKKAFLPYFEIIPALLREEITWGILIHEGRFIFEKYGLSLITDLGVIWEEKLKVPRPLGGFFIKRNLPEDLKNTILRDFRKSLKWAKENKEATLPILKQYAQELDPAIIFKHVETYVNHYTFRLEKEALEGLKKFLDIENYSWNPKKDLWEISNGNP